jgi:hypothetical protein
MAIESLEDLSSLSVAELYSVYVAIARADHRWRIRALYGDQPRPAGHSEFRPLPMVHFEDRLRSAREIVGGEKSLRARLSRQAAAYKIDVHSELRCLKSKAA